MYIIKKTAISDRFYIVNIVDPDYPLYLHRDYSHDRYCGGENMFTYLDNAINFLKERNLKFRIDKMIRPRIEIL